MFCAPAIWSRDSAPPSTLSSQRPSSISISATAAVRSSAGDCEMRGIPFVVHTGYPPMLVSREWPDVPVISKPALPDQIVAALMGALR